MAKYANSKDKFKINLNNEELERIGKIIDDYRELLVAIGNL